MNDYPDAYRASAYDDPLVIEGNATLGDEIASEDFDVVISPIGGGGLISGISTGLCRSGSNAALFGAEPLLGNDAARSLAAGKIIRNKKEPATVADGARTVSLGGHNWEIIKDGVRSIYEVGEADIIKGLQTYFGLANLKVEPTGALTLGAVMANKKDFAGKRICIVVSGGNVDPANYANLLMK